MTTRAELMRRARLLSNARVSRNGKIPDDPAKWWAQIELIALELDMPITWEEWHSLTKRRADDQEELPL